MNRTNFLDRIRNNLRTIMAIRGWSQTDIAREIRCDGSYVARILSTKKLIPPSEDFISRFSEVAEISVEALLHTAIAKRAQRFLASEFLPDRELVLSPHLSTSDELIPRDRAEFRKMSIRPIWVQDPNRIFSPRGPLNVPGGSEDPG
jgi:transcriptional regulator with XRE-family HTH domain